MHTFFTILGIYTGIGAAVFLFICLLNMWTVGGMLFQGGKVVAKVFLFCVFLWPAGLFMFMSAMDEGF